MGASIGRFWGRPGPRDIILTSVSLIEIACSGYCNGDPLLDIDILCLIETQCEPGRQ